VLDRGAELGNDRELLTITQPVHRLFTLSYFSWGVLRWGTAWCGRFRVVEPAATLLCGRRVWCVCWCVYWPGRVGWVRRYRRARGGGRGCHADAGELLPGARAGEVRIVEGTTSS
jgi:hypothetical protein